MRTFAVACLVATVASFAFAQDSDRDFSGDWQLNPARSDIRGRSDVPTGFLRVTQNSETIAVAASVREGEASTNVVYPLAAKSARSASEGLTFNAAAKWEGTALLTNVIVGGKADYAYSERWERSRDGSRLTITRTFNGQTGEVEARLLYERPGMISQAPRQPQSAPGPVIAPPPVLQSRREAAGTRAQDGQPATVTDIEYVLDPGTRILLRLTNSINTKRSAPGDRIYLETAAPVFAKGKLVVPRGSYVTGTVTESQRAGRVKGKSGLNFRFDTLTLPNGVTRDFRSRAGTVDAQGNLDRTEGRITGEGTKGKDAATVAGTTAAGTGIGAGIGAAAGGLGMGAGIGAAAGAVAGLAGVLGSRGQDVVITQGTTMELVLDRELRFTDTELFGRRR